MGTKKTNKIDTTKLNARKSYYDDKDIMQINSTIYNAKGSNKPFLSNKQTWLYSYLMNNDIKKNYTYTLTSLSNDYRKNVKDTKEKEAKKQNYKFRKSFKSSELISINDLKAVIQYMYIVNGRLFEYYRNENNNYLLHEVECISNLVTCKDRKQYKVVLLDTGYFLQYPVSK